MDRGPGTDQGIELVTVGPPVMRVKGSNAFATLGVDLSPDEKSIA